MREEWTIVFTFTETGQPRVRTTAECDEACAFLWGNLPAKPREGATRARLFLLRGFIFHIFRLSCVSCAEGERQK
jgi:hypothetical protein